MAGNAFDTRPRYGHNHAIGLQWQVWSKVTYMARAKGYVMARRPRCSPFVLAEKEWLNFPLYDGQPNRQTQSEEKK